MDINEIAKQIAAKSQGSPKGSNEAYDDANPFKLFGESIVSSMGPEMFGFTPAEAGFPNVERFREENAIPGLASQLIGPGAIYGTAYKAGKLPKVSRFLDKVGDSNTFLGNAKRSAVLMGGGVEAPRVIGSAILGGDTEETTSQALFNTALETTFGGMGGAFRAMGKAAKKDVKLGANIDLKQPAPVIAQDLIKAIDEGKVSPADLPQANNMLANLVDTIKNESSDTGLYINSMVDGDAQPLNRLFRPHLGPNTKGIVKKHFTPGAFESPQALDDVIESAGLKDNFPFVQYPRYLEAVKDGEARSIEAAFKTAGMKSVGENTFLGQEADGLYVMAKKISGDIGSPTSGDKWALFKTNSPNKFSKNAQAWGDQIAEKNAWMVEKPRAIDPANPLDILDEGQKITEAMPINGFYQALKGPGKALNTIGEKLGLDGSSEAAKRIKAVFVENFAPAMFAFKSNPRAQYVFANAKTMFQKAESMAHVLTYGDEALGEGTNLYSRLLAKASLSGTFGKFKSFAKIIEPLDENQIAELNAAVDSGLEGKALAEAFSKGNISKAVFDALGEIKPLDDYMIGQTKGTMEATGQSKKFSPIRGHYLLPRTWKGDWRVPIKNENGRLVYVASGRTRDSAIKQAEGILASPETKGWKSSAPVTADSTDDLALATQVATGSPEFMTASALKYKLTKEASRPQSFKVRTGVGGYEKDLTKEELVSKFYNNQLARQRYLAELSTNHLLGDQLARVGLEDASLARSLQRRLDALAGRQGEVGKFINKEVDKVFSPVLGKNSATKIAGAINEYNHMMTLGMGNLAYPTMNMLSFLQNTLPKVAFTLNATDESLARHYTYLPLSGTDGKVRGSLGMLEPLRILKAGFAEMKNPDKALNTTFAKALREGVVDPKFMEEWAGQQAKQIMNLKGVLKGEEPFPQFIRAVSNFLPSQSEKLVRGHALTVGHIVGRDVFKLADDALYRFAKEFTEKTMYNYSAADRPRVFTGPLGSIFGQFKTWTTHYIGDMLTYADEGFNYNNWSPFLWQMGATTAVGGVSATALYPVADKVSEWLNDKPLMETIYERMGGGSGGERTGNIADGVFMGLPMFAGVSLSGQASDPFSDPSRTASMLFSFVQMQRAQALSKAVGQAVDNWSVTGQHPIDSEQTRDLFISALAPKTVARFAAQTEDQAIKSLNNGNKLYGGLNAAERIMYTTGFMPKRIALQKEVNEQLWKDQAEMKKKVSSMGRLWAEAERDRDFGLLTELQQTALASGIPIDSVLRSAKTQNKNASVEQVDRQFKPQAVMKLDSLNIVQ